MKQLVLSIPSNDQPLYLRIASAIREAVKTRQLEANEQLPSARLLSEQLAVNRHTIMAAYQELIAEGWITARQRQGYFVESSLPVESSASLLMLSATTTTEIPYFDWQSRLTSMSCRGSSSANYQYNFSGGCPDISLFPFKTFASCLSESMLHADHRALNYGDNDGFAPYLHQVSQYLKRVRSMTNKRIVAVNGSQEALYLLSQVLLNSGDRVAVEKLGYQPAWAAFKNAGAQLIGIDQDAQGMVPEHLAAMADAGRLRLIYLTPLHQYPTTVTLPVARRLAIYQIAVKYQIPIIEDDYDHEFHYRCQPLPPMAADDPAGLVVYLSTFSKIMFPGIRMGFMACDPALADAIVNYRLFSNHKANVVVQDAIARWMADGAFERHLRKLTRTYQKRRDFMVTELENYQAKGMDLQFQIPDGGMAMWVKTAVDANELVYQAGKKGIFIQAEDRFHLEQKRSENRYIRLGFAGMDEVHIAQGLSLLFDDY